MRPTYTYLRASFASAVQGKIPTLVAFATAAGAYATAYATHTALIATNPAAALTGFGLGLGAAGYCAIRGLTCAAEKNPNTPGAFVSAVGFGLCIGLVGVLGQITNAERNARLDGLPVLNPETAIGAAPTYASTMCKNERAGARLFVTHKGREYAMTCP